jgi:hypothetical protein
MLLQVSENLLRDHENCQHIRTTLADAATLLVCLREVEKCNVFIGIYGARYGLSLSADGLKGA